MRRDPYPFTTAPNVEPFNKPPVRDWARDHLWRHPEILRALELPVTRQKRVGLVGCAGAVLFGGDGTTDRARRSIGWAEAVPIVARVISVATDTRLRIMAMASNLNRQTDSLGKPEIALRVGDQLAASCFLSRGRSTSPVTFPGGPRSSAVQWGFALHQAAVWTLVLSRTVSSRRMTTARCAWKVARAIAGGSTSICPSSTVSRSARIESAVLRATEFEAPADRSITARRRAKSTSIGSLGKPVSPEPGTTAELAADSIGVTLVTGRPSLG